MTELSPGDRLRQLRRKANLTQPELAEKAKVGQSSISDFENNKKSMSAESLASVAKVLKSTTEYIIYGGSNAYVVDKKINTWTDGDSLPEGVVAIKFYKGVHVSAGDGYSNEQYQQPEFLWFKQETLNECNVDPKSSSVIIVQGDSMWPELTDRQAISVDESARKIFDGEIYAFRVGDDIKVKYLFRWNEKGEGGFKAVSRNEDKVRYPDEYYSPARIEAENVEIIGQYWWKSETRRVRR